MKSKLIMLSAIALVFFASQGFAEDGVMVDATEVTMEEKGSMMEQEAEPVSVGNKICPVSGEAVGSMGEGVQVEHEGKVYNLCCAMCEKMFKKDPDQFVKNIEKEINDKKDIIPSQE